VEWRILDWLPDYEISENGVVRRATDSADPRYSAGYVVKGFMAGSCKSYRYYKLSLRAGPQIKIGAHRLVCEAWHGPPPEGHEAAHSDGNSLNNNQDNLRWATPAQNGEDTRQHGTQKGERNPGAVLTADIVRQIRVAYANKLGSQSALGQQFGISRSQCGAICRGEAWTHAE